jgi:hypothetical protein
MYEKKIDDGYEVLEVPKGNCVEAIFAKLKPEPEKLKMKFTDEDNGEIGEDDDEDFEVKDDYKNHDDDDSVEDPDDDEITEENYSTMMDLSGDGDDEESAQLIEFADD